MLSPCCTQHTTPSPMRARTTVICVAAILAGHAVSSWCAWVDRWNQCEHGCAVSIAVALLPLAAPFIHMKDVLVSDETEAVATRFLRPWVVPSVSAFVEHPFTEPDYNDEDRAWNALPHRHDTADELPPHCGTAPCSPENQQNAAADLFFVGPSTFYSPLSWNCDWDSSNTRYLVREAIIPQQAAIFNSAARIYSPSIRQMSGFGFLAVTPEQDAVRQKAANIAYSDVRRAFRHYLAKWNKGRPILLAGHSQGAEYMLRLVRDEFAQNKSLALVAAYAVGMPAYKDILAKWGVPPCESAEQTGCVVAWQTYVAGTDPKHFYFEPSDPTLRKVGLAHDPSPEALASRVCVNPLTWSARDGEYAGREHNRGGMHLLQWVQNLYFLFGPPTKTDVPGQRQVSRVREGLLPLKPSIVGATCVNGSLFVDSPPFGERGSNFFYTFFSVWRFASFPGNNLHPYDYNFFWADIRHGVERRVKAWVAEAEAQAAAHKANSNHKQ